MAGDLGNLVLGVLELLKGSFFIALQAWVILLIANYLRKKLPGLKSWSWIKSSAATAYLAVLALVNVVYILPILSVAGKATSTLPDVLQPTLLESLGELVLQEIRLAVVALVLAAVLLPLIVVGDFIFEWLQRRFGWNYFLPSLVSAYAITVVAMAAILFTGNSWVITGIFYLILFGFVG